MYTCLQLQSYIFIGQSYKVGLTSKSDSPIIDHQLPETSHQNVQRVDHELLGKGAAFIFPPCSPCRCSPGRAGEALPPEAAAVLRPLRLPVRPVERPKMEGSEACGAQRDGGVHHAQQERHHRAHLPGGGAHGE